MDTFNKRWTCLRYLRFSASNYLSNSLKVKICLSSSLTHSFHSTFFGASGKLIIMSMREVALKWDFAIFSSNVRLTASIITSFRDFSSRSARMSKCIFKRVNNASPQDLNTACFGSHNVLSFARHSWHRAACRPKSQWDAVNMDGHENS